MTTPSGTPRGMGRGYTPWSGEESGVRGVVNGQLNPSAYPPGQGRGVIPERVGIDVEEYRRLRTIEANWLRFINQGNRDSPAEPDAGAVCAGGCRARERYPKVIVNPYAGSPTDSGPKKFLQQAEQLKVGQNLGDRVFLDRWVPTLLTDEALDWFLGQPAFNSWAEFKVELSEKFQAPNADDVTYELIISRLQGPDESVEAYVHDMMFLFRKMQQPVAELERVRLIYRNLRNPLRVLMSLLTIDSVQTLVARAMRLESAAKQREFSLPLLTPEHTERPNVSGARPKTRGSEQTDYCYICGEEGHYARSCPRRVKSQAPNGSGNDTGARPRPGTAPRE